MDKVEELEDAKTARLGAARWCHTMGRAFVEGCPELGQLHEGLALALEAGDEEGVKLMMGSIVDVLGVLAEAYEKADNAVRDSQFGIRLWTPQVMRGGKVSGDKG